MSFGNFEKTDNVDNVDNVEKTDRPEGYEKEGVLNKIKDFFSEFGKKKEGKEDGDEKSDRIDEAKKKMQDEKQAFIDSLKVDAPSYEEQAETAKKFREENNLDEHGYPTEGWKRPEGGFERDRADDNDPRRSDFESSDEYASEKIEENKENKVDDE